MKDINFFTPYIDKRKIKFNNKFFLISVFSILFISIAGYSIFNQLRITKLSEGRDKLKIVTENPKMIEKVEAIRVEEEELDKLKVEVESIRILKEELNKKDFLDSKYIDSIISKKPTDLFLTSINIDPESVSITGISDNRMSIAEFGQGLKMIEDLEDIFISNITKENIDYTFELERNKTQEVEDEANQEESEEE